MQEVDRRIEEISRYPLAGIANPTDTDRVNALEAVTTRVKDLVRQKANPNHKRQLDSEMMRVDGLREDLGKLMHSARQMLEQAENDLAHTRKNRNDLKDKGGPGLGWYLRAVVPMAVEKGLIRVTDGAGWEAVPLPINP
jgi:hypothetical protein